MQTQHTKAQIHQMAHLAAIGVLAGTHPELQSKIEALAEQGFEAQDKGDFATSAQTYAEARSLIAEADKSKPDEDDVGDVLDRLFGGRLDD